MTGSFHNHYLTGQSRTHTSKRKEAHFHPAIRKIIMAADGSQHNLAAYHVASPPIPFPISGFPYFCKLRGRSVISQFSGMESRKAMAFLFPFNPSTSWFQGKSSQPLKTYEWRQGNEDEGTPKSCLEQWNGCKWYACTSLELQFSPEAKL
ncbi:hypothetical protein DsansV1_C21g0167271 [Dioscorea sansibarensis]